MPRDSIPSAQVTPEEHRLVHMLGAVWNAFLDLPVEHADDRAEFRHAIHRSQDIVLARAGRRSIS